MKKILLLLIAVALPLNAAFAAPEGAGRPQDLQISKNIALIDELSALQKQLGEAKLSRQTGVILGLSALAVSALGIKFGALHAAKSGGDLTGPMNAFINMGAKGAVVVGGLVTVGAGYKLAVSQSQIDSLSQLIEAKTAELKSLTETIKNN